MINNGLYLSSGAKVFNEINLGNNVTITPNSLVNHNFDEDNITLAGCPAKIVRSNNTTWWERDGNVFVDRYNQVESLKLKLGL